MHKRNKAEIKNKWNWHKARSTFQVEQNDPRSGKRANEIPFGQVNEKSNNLQL